jgi:hypothetical protein
MSDKVSALLSGFVHTYPTHPGSTRSQHHGDRLNPTEPTINSGFNGEFFELNEAIFIFAIQNLFALIHYIWSYFGFIQRFIEYVLEIPLILSAI